MPAQSGSLAGALLAAARVIAAVGAGRSLAAALPEEGAGDDIRAQVQDLAFGTLRRYGWGDFILARLLDRPLPEPLIHCLLLAALYRLESRPESAYAIVDQAVEAAGEVQRGRFRGLTNAVLRNYLRRREALLAAAAADDVASHWHPAWWLERLRAAWPDAWPAIVAAGNGQPPMTLRVNRRQGTPTAYLAELAAAGRDAEVIGTAALRLARPVPVEALPGFALGRVSVQDAGAQHAAELLDVADGQRVLDACAAPGGKCAHVLELAAVELLALDVDERRCRRIVDNLARLRLHADVRAADASRPADWWDGRTFDRILADVPCSATGVVRRHPDIKWLRRPEDIAAVTRTQDELLATLWPLLRPGGKLLYSTCSVFPIENEERIAGFMARTTDARRESTLQLLPDENHDGFFHALLRKAA